MLLLRVLLSLAVGRPSFSHWSSLVVVVVFGGCGCVWFLSLLLYVDVCMLYVVVVGWFPCA